MDTQQAIRILRLPPDADASKLTEDQIKKAFRARAKEFHPDKHEDASTSKKRHMQREFLQLTEAAEYLGKQAAIDFTMGEIRSAKGGAEPESAIDWLGGLGKTIDWLGIKSNELFQSLGKRSQRDVKEKLSRFSDANNEPTGYSRTGRPITRGNEPKFPKI